MAHNDKQERKRSRVPYMVLSLIIAIVIWSLVAFTTDIDITKKVSNLKVSYVGEQVLKEKGYVVLGIPDEPDFWVKLDGHRRDIIDTIDRIRIELDVSDIAGAGEVELEGTVRTYNSQVSVLKKSFTTIPVTVEEYEEKEIPIEVKQIGSFKNNPVLSEPEFRRIRIAGAKSEIDRVESGYVTVDLARLSESGSTVSGVILIDSEGDAITDTKTIEGPTASMRVENTICEYAELPVKPVLDKTLEGHAVLDEENTVTDPDTVKIAVLPGYSFSEIEAVIALYTTDEITVELREEEGMYIPEEDRYVTITPAFVEQDEK